MDVAFIHQFLPFVRSFVPFPGRMTQMHWHVPHMRDLKLNWKIMRGVGGGHRFRCVANLKHSNYLRARGSSRPRRNTRRAIIDQLSHPNVSLLPGCLCAPWACRILPSSLPYPQWFPVIVPAGGLSSLEEGDTSAEQDGVTASGSAAVEGGANHLPSRRPAHTSPVHLSEVLR